MIQLEDREWESLVVWGETPIAVPLEICRAADGTLTLTSFSACEETARRFEERFGNDPFSPSAAAFLRRELTPLVRGWGFEPDSRASGVIREFLCTEAHTRESEEASLLLPERKYISSLTFTPQPVAGDDGSLCAAVLRNARVVAAAQVNDIRDDEHTQEINVETAVGWRGRGFAASCVRVLTAALLRRGFRVLYCCRDSNKASAAVAAAAGFQRRGERRSFVCYRIGE